MLVMVPSLVRRRREFPIRDIKLRPASEDSSLSATADMDDADMHSRHDQQCEVDIHGGRHPGHIG
ncbi:hypothetical protein [Streptomyces sp. NPDC048340]|uniref:hypothetical protein n=1 Tax=Streptomyces sp. NPDC048340 TaxID=3365537 RepID=UPI00371C933C